MRLGAATRAVFIRDLPQDVRLRVDAEAVIARLLHEGHPLFVAYSGGKDSTTLLSLALNAAALLRATGVEVPPLIITHGDTGIENPMVAALARREMQKAEAFGREQGLQVMAEVAEPALNETWAVAILSGRRLPTFTNSSSRDCTLNWKVNPMVRLRKRLLAQSGVHRKPPVTLIGTRFEESTSRALRMDERGERASVPWEKDGSWFLSPLAHWTSDDVWTYLAHLRSGDWAAFTDSAEVFDLYAQAGGSSCAVVADMATEDTKKSRACGARFGCSLCAAVGRDKSLENLLQASPEHAWLRPLNALQQFIVNTQYDLTRRNWVTRTLDADGYLRIQPDTYAPAMLQELLRYALTVDMLEQEEANRLGLPKPRFQLVPPSALLAIDALWSLHAHAARPFEALAIWRDVVLRGQRFVPPSTDGLPTQELPAARYLWVGADWEQGPPGVFTGMQDPALLLAAWDTERSGHRELPDGRMLLNLEHSELFEVDAEGAELFLAWEAERVLAEYHDGPAYNSVKTFLYYAEARVLGTFSRHQSTLDRMMRRAQWKRDHGWDGSVELDQLLAASLDKSQRDADAELRRRAPAAPAAAPTLNARPLRERLCTPRYL